MVSVPGLAPAKAALRGPRRALLAPLDAEAAGEVRADSGFLPESPPCWLRSDPPSGRHPESPAVGGRSRPRQAVRAGAGSVRRSLGWAAFRSVRVGMLQQIHRPDRGDRRGNGKEIEAEERTRLGDPHRGPTGLTAATVAMATRGSPRRSPRPRRWGQSPESGSGGSGGLEPDSLSVISSAFSSAVSAVSAVNPSPPSRRCDGWSKRW